MKNPLSPANFIIFFTENEQFLVYQEIPVQIAF